MEDLGNKPFAFQQKVADCRVMYLAFGGRHHEAIEREMRALGHESFNRRVLYARNDRGKHTPGWPERFGWDENGKLKIENGELRSKNSQFSILNSKLGFAASHPNTHGRGSISNTSTSSSSA